MSNGQLDISIIVVVFAIIGAILLLVGTKQDKRLLRFLGIGFLIGAGVSLFIKSAELRDILTALSAVIAIFIAAFSFDESRRLRQETNDREKRDKKERLLNEIIEWASDGIRLCALHKVRTKATMVEAKYTRIADLVALHSKRESISVLARQVDKRLTRPVNKAITALTEYLGGEKGTGILHLLEEHEGEEIINIYPEVWTEFEKSFRKLLTTLSRIKSEL